MAEGLAVIGAGFGRTGTLSLKQALERLGFGACYHMAEVATHPEHAELWLRAWHGEDVWDTLFSGYRAAVDWPAAAFWPRLMERYPDAKVLLSLRDPDSWFRSASGTIFQSMEHARRSAEEEPSAGGSARGLPSGEEPSARGSARGLPSGEEPSARGSARGLPSGEEPSARGSARGLPSGEKLRTRLRMANEIIREGTFDGRLMDRDHAITVYEANVARVRAEVPADRLIEFQASDGWAGLAEPLGVAEPEEPYPWVNTSEEFLDRWRNRPDPGR